MKGVQKLRIAISGHGQMGQTIRDLLPEYGHQFAGFFDTRIPETLELLDPKKSDVLIDFSVPDSAFEVISQGLKNGIPVVSGTTGWLSRWDDVQRLVRETNGAFFYASNFNIGVNLFFELNEKLAKIMAPYSNQNQPKGQDAIYTPKLEEWHHTRKKDAPSGTAITLAEGLLKHQPGLESWKLQDKDHESVGNHMLPIKSYREGNIVGTHRVTYSGKWDELHIEHRAHNRSGFARGAIVASEFIIGKQGHYSMSDLLNTST